MTKPGRGFDVRLGEVGRRRLRNFRANRRGYWSLWIFVALFLGTLLAEFVANDKPLLVRYEGDFFFPVLRVYPETVFAPGEITPYIDPTSGASGIAWVRSTK